MEQSLNLITENVKELKKRTDTRVEYTVYNDRVRVDISKQRRNPLSIKVSYRFYVHVYFVYEGKEVYTESGYYGLKKALKYASDIFIARNSYMHKYNYTLST